MLLEGQPDDSERQSSHFRMTFENSTQIKGICVGATGVKLSS